MKKTFSDLEKTYRERQEKLQLEDAVVIKGNGMGEHVERDSLVVLDDVNRLAVISMTFVTFMITCRKFGYSLLYVFCETADSSPR